jgi:transcriptional regulator with XRE-family HTH domain
MSTNPRYEPMAAQLLRALRGRRSQVAFSRRLGYRSNVAHTWETGKRWPTGAVSLEAARRVGVDLDAGLRRFTKFGLPFLEHTDPASPEGVAALLASLRRELPLTEVARRSGASRFQVSRWLKGQAEPRLPELLAMVDACTGRVLDFLAVLVDPADVPVAAEPWRRLEAARQLFWREPWAQLVLLGLDLADYQALPAHDGAWLGARLGLEVDEVERLLQRLFDTGQIRFEAGRWRIGEVHTVDTRRHPEAGLALKRFWAEVARDRLDHAEASLSYNVFTVSQADLDELIALYRSTYIRARAIVAASEPSERVVLVQQHVLPLDGSAH